MFRLLLDTRPQLDDRDSLLTYLLPSVILYTPEYVTVYLSKGAGPNGENRHWSALSSAISVGNEELAKLLVEKGADVSDNRLIGMAAQHRMDNLIKLILDKGCDITTPSKYYMPVVSAANKCRIDTLTLLLGCGADIDGTDADGQTALGTVSYNGNAEVAKILLKNGANPNADSELGTPIIRASINGKQELVTLLVDHGADINLVSISRYSTALRGAAAFGSLALCRLLLAKGADPNLGKRSLPLLNGVDHYPFDIEAIQKIELLLENGADPTAKNRRGEYALESAVLKGHEDVVRLLLRYGAKLDVCGTHGSILHAAAASRNKEKVRIMVDLGAKVIETDDEYGGVLQEASHHCTAILASLKVMHSALKVGTEYLVRFVTSLLPPIFTPLHYTGLGRCS